MMINKMLYDYSYENRERFNPELFKRDDDDIIRELQNVILSCERDKFYTIKVDSFEVLESPIEIYEKLRSYEQARIDRSSKTKPDQENIYDNIPIKDSKIKLLIVNYIIGINNKFEPLQVLIAVPRYTDRYYYELQGNYYLPMHQIVDGSTYNNANTNSKSASTTQKTIFMPIKVFRFHNKLETVDGEEIPLVLYSTNIFSKNVTLFKYILAKYGLMGTFRESGIGVIKVLKDKPVPCEDDYVFEKNDIYITVPKMIFDADYVTQSLVYTIHRSIGKGVVYEDLFTIDHWILRLDNDVNITDYSYVKGIKLLESLEGIYDKSTMENLKLPMQYKDNVYKLLIWIARNFSDLMLKDNQDVSLKKVRMSEYIASLYAMRLSIGMHRISSSGKRASLSTIRKSINISPNYLLVQITKCNLVNYRNTVNEDDAIASTKYSYRGIAGIGEKKGANVADVQRRIDPSNLGIVDTCSSSDSAPGLTGVLCPYAPLRSDGFFKEYEEPNSWEDKFGKLMNEYKSVCGLVEVATFKNKILNQDNKEEIGILEETRRVAHNIMRYVGSVDANTLIIPGMIVPAYIE